MRMNRKLIYMFSLIGFFLTWGVFGFMAAGPRSEPVLQASALPEKHNVVTPVVTPNAAIPVTAEAQPGMGILFIYLLAGLGALFLILVLLNAANKQTIPHVRRGKPPDEP
jgi:hypothetical protein